jgi:hypothetical protein
MSTAPATLVPAGPHQPIDLATPGGAELIAFPSGRYSIPADDAPEFAKLRPAEQERVKFLLSLFAKMEAGGIVATSEALGFQLRALRGYGASNLRALYYKWQEGGWKLLARHFTNGGEKLPATFIQHLRALMENNARSMKQAMNLIKREWYAGRDIPGYGAWQQWFLTQWPERDLPVVCPGTPKGWSKSNLYALQPAKVQRMLATRGLAAAKALLPSMVRDPGTLLPLQLVVIDDFEIDQLCFYWDPVHGTRAIVRMSGLAAMDVATRRIIGLILKPRLPDDDGRKQSITRAEVRLLLYGILRDHSVPAHGMTILAEKAAAAVTLELELTFRNLFGGKIAVTRTSIIDRAVLENGFKDGGGKPWLKGWIESFFNLMHNVAAGLLPGQKGAHYLVKPADLDEKLRTIERLIGTGPRDAQLSDAQLKKARIPFASPAELCDTYLQIFKFIEDRTDHAMLGFDRVQEWRSHPSQAPQPWEALADLTEAEQLDAEMLPPRMQSPRERWNALYPRIQWHAVPAHVLMMLLLTPKKAALKGGKLTFVHHGQGYTWLADPRSELVQRVPEGAEVLCYFDPTRPDHAHVARADDGLPLGEVKRLGKVDITDEQAVTEAERTIAAHYAAHLEQIRERPLHQAAAAQLAEDRAINAALVTTAAELRNDAGLTATLNRTVAPAAAATTAQGEAFASAVVTAEHAQAAGKTAARALQRAASLDAEKLF